MKVTKKITTSIIGEVVDNVVRSHKVQEFTNGKEARKLIRKMQNEGHKVYLDSFTIEKCLVDIPDELVFENATITKVEKE